MFERSNVENKILAELSKMERRIPATPMTPMEDISTHPIDYTDVTAIKKPHITSVTSKTKPARSSSEAEESVASDKRGSNAANSTPKTLDDQNAMYSSDMKENEDVWVKTAKPPLKAKFQPEGTPTRSRNTPLKQRTTLSTHRYVLVCLAGSLQRPWLGSYFLQTYVGEVTVVENFFHLAREH